MNSFDLPGFNPFALPFPKQQILDYPLLKEFADNNSKFNEMVKVLQKGRKH